jgi:CBS domain-containing protein
MERLEIRIRDAMTSPAVRIGPDASLRDAALLFAASEASDVMVAGDDGRLVGVLSEGDLIRAMLPDIDEILGAGGSVQDALRVFIEKGGALASQPITPYLITDPITVAPDNHLAEAATILIQKMIRRLPVVQGAALVGTISRSDVCRAVLRSGSC